MSSPDTQLDVLAVFSHPDDAALSVAGTLLKLKRLGYRTGVCDMTRGEMGTRGTPEGRAAEAREAARILRLDARLNLGQPDGHVWLTEEARTAMVRVLRPCAATTKRPDSMPFAFRLWLIQSSRVSSFLHSSLTFPISSKIK